VGSKEIRCPIDHQRFDTSSSVIVPYYDSDLSILYLAGKGDASIKYFELTKEAPYLHYLSDFADIVSQQGATFLPKRACDTTVCEIAHCLRLMKDSIVPISFRVPRKSDLFQKDLYPDAYAGVPSMEAKEYLAGVNKPPRMKSMKPGTTTELVAVKSFTAKRSPQEIEEENNKLRARIAELEAQIAKLKKLQRIDIDADAFEVRVPAVQLPDSDESVTTEFPAFTFKTRTRKPGALRINPRDREMLLKTLNRSINLRIAS